MKSKHPENTSSDFTLGKPVDVLKTLDYNADHATKVMQVERYNQSVSKHIALVKELGINNDADIKKFLVSHNAFIKGFLGSDCRRMV